MLKAGLITGLLAIAVVAVITYLRPYWTPLTVPILGALAGYLANVFDKPSTENATAKTGTRGGTIGSIGVVIGQVIGTAINGFFRAPEDATAFGRSLGLPGSGSPGLGSHWMALIGGATCMSLLYIFLTAGCGALGGLIWWQFRGRNISSTPPSDASGL